MCLYLHRLRLLSISAPREAKSATLRAIFRRLSSSVIGQFSVHSPSMASASPHYAWANLVSFQKNGGLIFAVVFRLLVLRPSGCTSSRRKFQSVAFVA